MHGQWKTDFGEAGSFPCPECRAGPGEQCSYPDPDHPGRGIEVGHAVHAARCYDPEPMPPVLGSVFYEEVGDAGQ
jgi:hypothetical protein